MDIIASPAFLHTVYRFFLFASIFAFFLGIGLALRNAAALRFVDFMNRWVSFRKVLKPLMIPRFVEPAVMRRPAIPGVLTIAGATISVLLLKDVAVDVFRIALFSHLPTGWALRLAGAVKWLLLIGNGLCVLAGLSMIFSPRLLSAIEAYTDTWYSLRKHTFELDRMRNEFDNWVMANPTVSGTVLTILSLGMGAAVYARLFG